VRALQQRACILAGQPRSTLSYRAKPKDYPIVAEPLKELADQRPRWGWRRLFIMIKRKGIEVGEFRFRRIYRSLSLQVRPRKKRHVRYVRGNIVQPVSRPNERWSLDFMHDTLAHGRKIRTLMIIDDFTREGLSVEVEGSFSSQMVINVLQRIRFSAACRKLSE
jgi:putative transposase